MKDEEVWRVRHNNEINEIVVVEDIVRFIILKIEMDLARLRECGKIGFKKVLQRVRKHII